jgi:oxalate decarboxylase/phosphoglucose isomerase-like protein (cupin superfamily)
MSMHQPHIIEWPKIVDERGNLSFFQNNDHLPFSMQRVYWIYDVPGGEIRGGHAFRKMQECIVALSGSFDVILFDGKEERKFTLNRSYYGLYVPPMYWRRMENFSTNALAFVACDMPYDENDYIRELDEYMQEKK